MNGSVEGMFESARRKWTALAVRHGFPQARLGDELADVGESQPGQRLLGDDAGGVVRRDGQNQLEVLAVGESRKKGTGVVFETGSRRAIFLVLEIDSRPLFLRLFFRGRRNGNHRQIEHLPAA